MNDPDKARAVLSRAAPFVVATVLIDAIGFGIIIPVMPKLVMTLGHVSLAEATRIGGWMAAVYAAMQFVWGPIMGNLSDRFGRRPVLLAALGGFAIDYLLLGFAPTLAWLFVGRLIAGMFGASVTPAMAALADVSAPETRAKAFGLVSAAFGVGFILGPAAGGLLGEIGPRAPFYAAAALAAANVALGLFLFPETLPPEKRRPFQWRRANPVGALRSLAQSPGVLPFAAVYLLWNLASMIYPSVWSYFAMARFGWAPAMIGWSLAFVGLTMVLVQGFAIGRIVARFGERTAALIGIGSAAAAYTLFAFVANGWWAFPIFAISALQSLTQPSLNAIMSRRVDAHSQGELQGFTGSLNAVSAIVAPLIYNPAMAWFTGPTAPVVFPGVAFAMAAGIAVLCFLALLLLPKSAQLNAA